MPEIFCAESYVPHTTMKIYKNSSGRQTQYRFYPDDGYVMHKKTNDMEMFDETGLNVTEITIMYGSGMKSVPISYNFASVVQDTYTYTDENGMTVSVPIEKIGAEELYTLPESIVPESQVYGGRGENK